MQAPVTKMVDHLDKVTALERRLFLNGILKAVPKSHRDRIAFLIHSPSLHGFSLTILLDLVEYQTTRPPGPNHLGRGQDRGAAAGRGE